MVRNPVILKKKQRDGKDTREFSRGIPGKDFDFAAINQRGAQDARQLFTFGRPSAQKDAYSEKPRAGPAAPEEEPAFRVAHVDFNFIIDRQNAISRNIKSQQSTKPYRTMPSRNK